MMSGIVRAALRNLILTESWDVSTDQKKEAIDELVRLEREEAEKNNNGALKFNQMADFREHRKNHDRIATIKMVRSALNVGLMEALIIVKGIEVHDNIAL